MKTTVEGHQVEILKVYRNACTTTKEVKGIQSYNDLLRVRFSDGKVSIISETYLNQ